MPIATLTHSKKLTILGILHWIACTLGTLVTAYCLLRIVLTVKLSFDEVRYYSNLGRPYPLGYYLKEIGLAESIFTFLGVFAEFLLYLLLCHRAKKVRLLPWGTQYYRVMLVIHVVMFVLTSLISSLIWMPYRFPIRSALEKATLNLSAFADLSVLPAVLYSIAYRKRVRKYTSKQKQDTAASSTET